MSSSAKAQTQLLASGVLSASTEASVTQSKHSIRVGDDRASVTLAMTEIRNRVGAGPNSRPG